MDARWILEGVAADGSRVVHEIGTLPFSIGRDADNDLVVPALGLSRRHARLTQDPDGGLFVADLGSTNGTYVNRERLTGVHRLAPDDVIHFGNAEFRFGRLDEQAAARLPAGDRTVMAPPGQTLSLHFVPHENLFVELLAGRGLSCAVQPIVDARSGAPFAVELLGRSTHPGLPTSPGRLFNLAKLLDREADLSRAFRDHGLRAIASRLAGRTVFVNTHPKETFEPVFLASLERLPEDGVHVDLVVEVHETAVMEIERMRELAARLQAMGVRFAYDDFGAGQARLNELGDVPPHFVKFDMGLVNGLHQASANKQKVVSDLVRLVHELGSVALAEGIEVEADATLCRQMGFDLIQGYLTGRPVPIEQF